MCGIFGILSIHPENIYKRIIDGLTQLQNRGYDSSGLAVVDTDGNVDIHKYASTNQLDSLEHIKQVCAHKTALNYVGIGHNRWATHGMKNDTNAHPHVSCHGKYIIVHNGIIENYIELRAELIRNGFVHQNTGRTGTNFTLIEGKHGSSFEALIEEIIIGSHHGRHENVW